MDWLKMRLFDLFELPAFRRYSGLNSPRFSEVLSQSGE